MQTEANTAQPQHRVLRLVKTLLKSLWHLVGTDIHCPNNDWSISAGLNDAAVRPVMVVFRWFCIAAEVQKFGAIQAYTFCPSLNALANFRRKFDVSIDMDAFSIWRFGLYVFQ